MNGEGGLLADEMGLGKTIEILAVILSNTKKMTKTRSSHNSSSRNISKDYPNRYDTRNRSIVNDSTVNDNANDVSSSTLATCSSTEYASKNNVSTNTATTHNDMINLNEDSNIRPNNANTDTYSAIDDKNTIISPSKNIASHNEDNYIPPCETSLDNAPSSTNTSQSELDSSYGIPEPVLFNSKSTLIISPSILVSQWKQEITKHAPKLKVFVYEGMNKLSIKDKKKSEKKNIFHRHDIVLTSYAVLQKEVHYSEDYKIELRVHHKRYFTPLIGIHWWRICIDEAQEVKRSTTLTAKMVLQIPAVYRWAVSGTPIKTSFNDLKGILIFLRYDSKWHQSTPQLLAFLRTISWRHGKHHVTDEIAIPPPQLIHKQLEFSRLEIICREKLRLHDNGPLSRKFFSTPFIVTCEIFSKHTNIAPQYMNRSKFLGLLINHGTSELFSSHVYLATMLNRLGGMYLFKNDVEVAAICYSLALDISMFKGEMYDRFAHLQYSVVPLEPPPSHGFSAAAYHASVKLHYCSNKMQKQNDSNNDNNILLQSQNCDNNIGEGNENPENNTKHVYNFSLQQLEIGELLGVKISPLLQHWKYRSIADDIKYQAISPFQNALARIKVKLLGYKKEASNLRDNRNRSPYGPWWKRILKYIDDNFADYFVESLRNGVEQGYSAKFVGWSKQILKIPDLRSVSDLRDRLACKLELLFISRKNATHSLSIPLGFHRYEVEKTKKSIVYMEDCMNTYESKLASKVKKIDSNSQTHMITVLSTTERVLLYLEKLAINQFNTHLHRYMGNPAKNTSSMNVTKEISLITGEAEAYFRELEVMKLEVIEGFRLVEENKKYLNAIIELEGKADLRTQWVLEGKEEIDEEDDNSSSKTTQNPNQRFQKEDIDQHIVKLKTKINEQIEKVLGLRNDLDEFYQLLDQNVTEEDGFGTKLGEVFREIIRILKNNDTDKILVFSSWSEPLVQLSSLLSSNNIRFSSGKSISGLRSYGNPPQRIEKFRTDPDTIKQSTGLTLTQASHVLLLDPVDEASEFQAIGRAYRIVSIVMKRLLEPIHNMTTLFLLLSKVFPGSGK